MAEVLTFKSIGVSTDFHSNIPILKRYLMLIIREMAILA